MIIDTPGFDDTGALGILRVRKTRQVLNKTDIASLVIVAVEGMTAPDRELLELIQAKELPYLIVYNKMDALMLLFRTHFPMLNIPKVPWITCTKVLYFRSVPKTGRESTN